MPQLAHEDDPATEDMPAAHDEHTLAPANEYWPAAQIVGQPASDVICAACVPIRPAGQAVHADMPVAAAYEPAAHDEHTPTLDAVPVAQVVLHAVDEVAPVVADAFPPGQDTHVVDAEAPVKVEYKPAPHEVQLLDPVLAW